MPIEELTYDVDGWGTGCLWFLEDRLVWHELPHAAGAPHPTTRFQRSERNRTRGTRDRAKSVTARRLAKSLVAYFAGQPIRLDDVHIELDWCTPFQRAVADTLRAVPYGEVVTYGELAALAGHPNAQRAAGTFCARNRLPLVIPCHRVVAAEGIGGYGSLGRDFKRRLLALEGVHL